MVKNACGTDRYARTYVPRRCSSPCNCMRIFTTSNGLVKSAAPIVDAPATANCSTNDGACEGEGDGEGEGEGEGEMDGICETHTHTCTHMHATQLSVGE